MPNQAEIIAAAMETVKTEVIPALVAAFAGKVEEIPPTVDNLPQLFAKPEALADIADWLDNKGFNVLVDVAGVDYYPSREPRFEVVYHFRQLPGLGMLRVRVRCSEKEQIGTLSGRWPIANSAEREVYDQFGIKFRGHPNLKRVLNPDDWEGHPLRRDYPLRGPRDLVRLEMPADEDAFRDFLDAEGAAGNAGGNSQEGK